MEYVTKGLQPEDALRYFEEISAIPRGSGNEGAVARYICEGRGEGGSGGDPGRGEQRHRQEAGLCRV